MIGLTIIDRIRPSFIHNLFSGKRILAFTIERTNRDKETNDMINVHEINSFV